MASLSNNITDAEYVKKGLALWFNNKPEESEEFFKLRMESTPIFAGYSFIVCMNSIIAYDVDRIDSAQQLLNELEQKCNVNNGWLSSIRTKWFSRTTETKSWITKIEEQIILADTLMNRAILTYFTQDISGLMKGSWLLRKAWKIYQSTYNQIYSKYAKVHTNETLLPPEPQNYRRTITRTTSHNVCTANENLFFSKDRSRYSSQKNSSDHFMTKTDEALICDQSKKTIFLNAQVDASSTNFSSSQIPRDSEKPSKHKLYLDLLPEENGFICDQGPLTCPEQLTRSASNISFTVSCMSLDLGIEPEEVKRLMGAISFGYGIFQLSASLLPNHLLKIINFFGFESNRTVGISSLMYSRLSDDIRGTLSSVALLWFYTFGSQMFKNEDGYSDSDIREASMILSECKKKYPNSAIFNFFQGRIERMKANTNNAVEAYNTAFRFAAQKELKLLCLQEVSWCRMVQLDFADSAYRFNELRQICSFSKAFYAYLTAICQGAQENYSNLTFFRGEIVQLTNTSSRKDTQIAKFLQNRIPLLPSNVTDHQSSFYWKYLVYEVLYLWNALSNVSFDQLDRIIDDCKSSDEKTQEPIVGIKSLILGSALITQRRYQSAVIACKNCIKQREGRTDHEHVTVFAHYELAMLLLQGSNDNKDAAKQLLRDALLIKNYDLENRLVINIQKELKKLN